MRWDALAAILIGLILSTPIQAHMHNRPDLDTWLKGLGSPRSPCCDSTEAETMADPDWKTVEDAKECLPSEPGGNQIYETGKFHYCVRLQRYAQEEYHWYQVPDAALVTEPNKAGPALIWLYWAATGKPYIRCFLPGALT